MFLMSGCIKEYKMTDKFDWLPTECGPEKYPMKIIHGEFIFENGRSAFIPSGKILRNGWGKEGSIHLVGPDVKPVPVKMDIVFFSYTEDKFYGGSFDLPHKKMSELFHEGCVTPFSPDRKETYSLILAGVAPRGEISVWMKRGLVVEVASFQAEEIEVDWKRMIDNPAISREEFVRGTLEESLSKEEISLLKKEGVPRGRWTHTYRKKYDWKPEISPDWNKPGYILLDAFNGEVEFFDFSRADVVKVLGRDHALPKKVEMGWDNSKWGNCMQTIFFDEQEVFKAFDKFHEIHPGATLALEFEVSDVSETIRVFLKDDQHLIELKKIKYGTRYHSMAEGS